jgi:hypothetical protein
LAQVAYLRTLNDLNLRLEKCDATDVKQMNVLLHSSPVPIAGCFLMTLVLADALFFKQTHDTFNSVWNSKPRALGIFAGQVEIQSLDFFVALSSINGLIGTPGQSNYTRSILFSSLQSRGTKSIILQRLHGRGRHSG